MKSDLQKFNDFKKRHNLSYVDIAKMITDYAYSEDEYARTHFSKEYNISVGVFYKARDFAVICYLIDDDICERLKAKTARNYALHNDKNSKVESYKHFSELMERRNTFLYSFTDEEIIAIAKKYAEGITLNVIADEYEVCEKAIKRLLKRGVEDFIISTKLLESMKYRIKDVQVFSRLEEKRFAKRAEILKPYVNEIRVIKYQIKN